VGTRQALGQQAQQAVIGCHVLLSADIGIDNLSVGANSRVHDTNMNRVFWELAGYLVQHERRLPDVSWMNTMTDVDQHQSRLDGQNRSFHLGNVRAAFAEI
jgi:hypothetical protein